MRKKDGFQFIMTRKSLVVYIVFTVLLGLFLFFVIGDMVGKCAACIVCPMLIAYLLYAYCKESKVMNDEDYGKQEGVLAHEEGVSFLPCNIELSGLEVTLVNAMRRECTAGLIREQKVSHCLTRQEKRRSAMCLIFRMSTRQSVSVFFQLFGR